MKTEVSIEISKPPDVVWPILVDVERWPEWTPSMTKLERLDPAPFGVGSRVRIQQPKLKPLVWRVSEFDLGRSFTWKAQALGISAIGRHTIQSAARGCKVVLAIDQRGALAFLLRPFLRPLTDRYVQMEARGLKQRCEGA